MAPRKTPEQKANDARIEFINALRSAGVVNYQSKEFSVTILPSSSVSDEKTDGSIDPSPIADVDTSLEDSSSVDESGHDPLADEDAAIDAMLNPR